MKKIFAFIFISALGVGLIGLSGHLKSSNHDIHQHVAELASNCTDEIGCALAAPLLREVYNSAEALRRQQFSRDELPIIRIYMNDGAIEQLSEKRAGVLAKTRPIHIAGPDDWVKATALVQYADQQEQSSVSLRLKGDWGDHFFRPKKWSFRIKTRAGGYLLGMRVFSIQHPATRNFGYEPALLAHMRHNDIVGPRYRFVDVMINDFPIGIMALEEHFTKELLEAQNRRDGPILAMDEDPLWKQWDLNYNAPDTVLSDPDVWNLNFASYRDQHIKDYNGSDFLRGSIASNNTIRGQSLLHDFVNGRITPRAAFDYEKLSRYWVLASIWRACHGVVWHNRRYYFNPISNLLEPIGFDNIPHPNDTRPIKLCQDADIAASLQDPQFLDHVERAAADITSQLNAPEFVNRLAQMQQDQNALFEYEGFDQASQIVEPATLLGNMELFLAEFRKLKEKSGNFDRAYAHVPTHFVGEALLSKSDVLGMHLTSFYFPFEQGGTIEFRNLTREDIEVIRIYAEGKRGRVDMLDVPAFSLRRGDENPGITAFSVAVPDALLEQHSEFTMDYRYLGTDYSRPVYVQYKNEPSGFAEDALAALERASETININAPDKQIILSGQANFTESIAVPGGWAVSVEAGTAINFHNGALLKMHGPLSVNGTANAPVIMTVSSNLDYRDMGAWGGILVSKSAERSAIRFLELRGTATQNLATRQGFYGMTGCLSFFESDVDIVDSLFTDAQCEDALNIVKSDFILDRIEIRDARADAFDSDFSTGLIRNSIFADSGNDGIDISGTRLALEGIIMTNIADKAISVGEKSELDASKVEIDGANLGIVSKDLSVARANDVSFSNVSGTALMTYIKKQEYGPSSIECSDCVFLTEMIETGLQDHTRIVVNGISHERPSLTFAQMVSAGLIEQAVVIR